MGEPRVLRAGMQSALAQLCPPQCISCGEPTTSDFGLCGACWRDTPFISGLVCDRCGTPLPGEDEGRAEYCDDCMTLARPWERGRSVLLYKDNGRKLVLALKHGDRLDLARPAGDWLMRAARPILKPDMLVAPVPLHWTPASITAPTFSCVPAAPKARTAATVTDGSRTSRVPCAPTPAAVPESPDGTCFWSMMS